MRNSAIDTLKMGKHLFKNKNDVFLWGILMKRKVKKADIVLIFIYLLMIILNVASWLSTAFADWYARNILPVWVNIFSRASSIIPFSLGEMMIITAVVIVVSGIITYVLFMIFGKGKRKKIITATTM